MRFGFPGQNEHMLKALFALSLLLAAGCDRLPPPPEAGPTSSSPFIEEPVDDTTPTPTACHDLSAAQAGEALVIMTDGEFEPACFAISSTQGIQLANGGTTEHNFSIQDALDVDVEPEGRVTTDPLDEVLAPGTYDFVCKYHEGAGMIGVIIIE